ncbi:hypothetical protein GLOIN_2v1877815 [Rhizophagus clarus]|uniref:TPR-like protein n=1 Tax=Rhizophagus clarus TaxID=94130 RepID=A0A8H3LFB2_9GLOM|nr:hypothetical protein GLOIN_2v1877815 [Rhizophagus clarus]
MQSGSSLLNTNLSDSVTFITSILENTSINFILSKLEKDGFNTPDEKAWELISSKDLTQIKNLFALKLLFENQDNQFSNGILRNVLSTLTDLTNFDYYGNDSVVRLELHLRTLVVVLEKILFAPVLLKKELRDKAYNSLAKFAMIHKTTTRVMQNGRNISYDRNQSNRLQCNVNKNVLIKRNYNIDFLLIHLRDTLHSLPDNETLFQEIMGRARDFLIPVFSIASQVKSGVKPDSVGSLLPVLIQLRKGLSFKYPIASYYVDWREMLIIRQNLFNLSGNISKKFQEMVLVEYLWSYLEKIWIDVADKSILDTQSKFDKILTSLSETSRNVVTSLNDLAGNEPLVLPHTLWFGILDLAQNLIQNSTRTSIHGLCYYLAIESLNRAPSKFIQFKAIEILVYLHKINNQILSIIDHDFDQYIQKLSESNSTADYAEEFKILLEFVRSKCSDDFNLLYGDIGKGKGKEKGKEKGKWNGNEYSTNEQISKSGNIILEIIANEMTCPISLEPTDKICILKCQHILSVDSLKKLKKKICSECREKIEDNDVKCLSQSFIYKYLYSQFIKAGYILPSIEIGSSTNKQDDSDTVGNSKKQHQTYQNAVKELEEKNYKNAENWCKEFLKTFPQSYSIKCILAYTYRCLNNYEQAYLYLNEAIKLKAKKPIAWCIRGEIHFRQGNYNNVINDLSSAVIYKAKIKSSYIMLGISYYRNNDFENSLKNFEIALQNNSNNYLCLKYYAYIYEKQEKYMDTLKMLDKLLIINEKDSLILCYYGEILSKIERYEDAITYFTKANDIDPENIHNLNKRAVAYYILQEYDKALLSLEKVIQLEFSNRLAHYCKGLIYYSLNDISNSMISFERCIEIDPNNDLANLQLRYLTLKYLMNGNTITEADEIFNIDNNNKSLLFMRCKMYIELEDYYKAYSDLTDLFEPNNDISFVYPLKKYSKFWTYSCEFYRFIRSLTLLDDTNKFNVYMFKKYNVYFISNLYNLNENYQFQKGNSNSSSEKVLSLDYPFCLFRIHFGDMSYGQNPINVVWKINVKKINSRDAFIKFKIESNYEKEQECILKYEDILKLEGLGWIEYTTFNSIYVHVLSYTKFLIEIKDNSIDMQVDYVRFTEATKENNHQIRIHFPEMYHLLPFQTNNNTPEVFEDKYFSRRESENLLELNDIISNL